MRRAAKQSVPEWLIGSALTGLILIAVLADWSVLRSLNHFTYDVRSPLRAAPTATEHVLVVAIDDDSITRVGRWPWPRSTFAQLINILRESDAAVIGMDILFSEPDQTQGLEEIRGIQREIELQAKTLAADLAKTKTPSPAGLIVQEIYAQLTHELVQAEARLDHDAKLADAVASTPQIVLSLFFQLGKPLGGESDDGLLAITANGTDRLTNPADLHLFPLIEARKMAPPLPAFRPDGIAVGHINVKPDDDGVLRREMLLIEYQGKLYPSFALRLVSEFLKVAPDHLDVTLGREIAVGPIHIPTDPLMRLPISYPKPGRGFRTVPAHALLSGEVLPEVFRDKLVIVGLTATGIADRNVTPMSAATPGVEVVAATAENILEQHFITQPGWTPVFDLTMIGLVGGFLALALPRLGAKWGGLATVGLLLLVLTMGAGLFAAHGYVVGVAAPGLLLVAGYTAITAKRFFLTEQRTELAEADTIETNKMLGLTFQGQGMLDLAFEKFAKCPLDDTMMGLLYNLGLDFERKRMFNKAVAVYEHIATQDRGFKDISGRIARLKQVGETMIFGGGRFARGGNEETLVTGGGEKPTLGRYEIVSELGRGAMGVVYLGQDPKIHRQVAIKTMRLDEVEPSQSAEVKDRFFREAQSAGRLSHPNIVTIYDAGEEQDLGYIAMEVLEGTDLKDFCRKDKLLPVRRTIEIIASVADALEYAHGQGIVHRDIKPANIMLMNDGTVKVTDFGIARITTSSKTQTGLVLGTPSYMSPEQLAGTKVDGRSDLFALGVVLFELLTGEKPFQGDSMATLMFQIANQPHPALTSVRPDVPGLCQAIIDRALQKDSSRRYQRGAEMAKDLRASLQTVP